MDWILVIQDRIQWRALVKTVVNIHIPYKAEKFLSSWATSILSGLNLLYEV
jgi:hypothetical protein